jgi:hypothetical protein
MQWCWLGCNLGIHLFHFPASSCVPRTCELVMTVTWELCFKSISYHFFPCLTVTFLSVIFCKDSPLSMCRLGDLMHFPCVLCKISWQIPSVGFRAIVIFSLKWLLLCIVTSYQCTSLFRKALCGDGWQVVNFIVSAQEARGLNQKTVIKKAAKFS